MRVIREKLRNYLRYLLGADKLEAEIDDLHRRLGRLESKLDWSARVDLN